MKSIIIVIASVLKPVDDTRMYEKFAISLSQTNKYEINIIGFSSKKNKNHHNIFFYPLFNFPRLSFGRLSASWKYYKKIHQLKPEVIIFNTHELLIVSCIYKIIFGTKLLYDVRENYYRNIRYTTTFPIVIKNIVAGWVRLKEHITNPFIEHYILAEQGYQKELPFTAGKRTIVENKFQLPENLTSKRKKIKAFNFLYSGTIATHYGIFEAIDFIVQVKKFIPEATLTIIGHSALRSTLLAVKNLIDHHSFISLIGGHDLVPHEDILEAILKADYGIISYQPNRSTENCIPTRIYEYMALQLPMVVQDHLPWITLTHSYQAAIPFNFKDLVDENLVMRLKTQVFYTAGYSENLKWEKEAEKLIHLMEKIS